VAAAAPVLIIAPVVVVDDVAVVGPVVVVVGEVVVVPTTMQQTQAKAKASLWSCCRGEVPGGVPG
jgi:hypothetical protein